MRRKYKLTGCAKIFLVLIILAPLAYLGAAYFNGENGIENIKEVLGIESSESEQGQEEGRVKVIDESDMEKAEQGAGESDRINELEADVRRLEQENEKLKQENLKLKNQLQNQGSE